MEPQEGGWGPVSEGYYGDSYSTQIKSKDEDVREDGMPADTSGFLKDDKSTHSTRARHHITDLVRVERSVVSHKSHIFLYREDVIKNPEKFLDFATWVLEILDEEDGA